jgi:L-serine/L-threonine ammonia-lyase
MRGVIPDAIVCCVGGGGLIGGIFKGKLYIKIWLICRSEDGATTRLERWYFPNLLRLIKVTVVAVETHGAGSFYASYTAGEHVSIPAITSIAKSLGAKKISKLTYDLSRQHAGHVSSMLVSDAQAANATWRFAGKEIFLYV